MAGRILFLVLALGVGPALVWYWFFTGDDPPWGRVWLAWVIMLGTPVLVTVIAGVLTRRSVVEILGVAVASATLALGVIGMWIALYFDLS